MNLSFPSYIFSEKEIRDFKRRQQVAKLLRVGESWKNIKEETGAHLQTIAIISKRLKSERTGLNSMVSKKLNERSDGKGPVFVFGHTDK